MLTAVTPIVPSYTVGEAGGSSVEHNCPPLSEQLCAQVGGPALPEIWRAAVALVAQHTSNGGNALDPLDREHKTQRNTRLKNPTKA
jgi:hypothetical protein